MSSGERKGGRGLDDDIASGAVARALGPLGLLVLVNGRVRDPRLEAWLTVLRRRVVSMAIGDTDQRANR